MGITPVVGEMVFASGYTEARRRIVETADRLALRSFTFEHPEPGPEGEALHTDVLAVGPADASTVVVIVSATHGVEGFLGSALQQRILNERLWNRANDVRWVLVHALNPWGYAWLRRVTENNVDLNRNFVDFEGPLPDNDEYGEIASSLAPPDLNPSTLLKADEQLWAMAERLGHPTLQAVITRGQYVHPEGLYFGGHAPCWSAKTFRLIVERELSVAQRVVMIDVHTGLGAYGATEVIVESSRESAVYRRARRIWGDRVRSTVDGESLSPALAGAIDHALVDWLPHAEVTPVALEVGTRSPLQLLQALRADNWLHTRGNPRGRHATAIKEQIRDAFYPDEESWRGRVMDFGWSVLDELLTELA